MKNMFNRIISAFYIINAVLFLFSFSMIDLMNASRSEIIPVVLMFLIGSSMIMYAYGDNIFKNISSNIDLAKINFYLIKSIAYLSIAIFIIFIIKDSVNILPSENYELFTDSLIIPTALLFEGVLIILYLKQSEKLKLNNLEE